MAVLVVSHHTMSLDISGICTHSQPLPRQKKPAEKLISSNTYFCSNSLADVKIIPVNLNVCNVFKEQAMNIVVSQSRTECSLRGKDLFQCTDCCPSVKARTQAGTWRQAGLLYIQH